MTFNPGQGCVAGEGRRCPTGETFEAGRGCVPEAAPAQSSDTNRPGERDIDRARRLFQRGIEYEQKQSWAKALEMMQQVALVKLTPQVQYHMALCEENLGNLDTALSGYKSTLVRADAVGASFKREVEQKVRDLEARIRGGAP